MKKGLLLIIMMFSLVILMTGCGKKKHSVTHCELTQKKIINGYTLKSSYDIYSTNDIVDKVISKEVITSDNESLIAYLKEYLKKTYETQNKTYGGTTNEIIVKGSKLTSTTTFDYGKMNLKKFAKDNPSVKNYLDKNNNLKAEGIKNMYKSLGAVCE